MIAISLARFYRGTDAERTGNTGWAEGDLFYTTDTATLYIFVLSGWEAIT